MSPTRLAVVTGPTSGIGLAIAEQLAAAGWSIVAIARSAARLDATGLRFAERVICDLSDPAAAATALDGLDLVGVDRAVLVNNAGAIEPIGRGADVDPAIFARTMALNATTPLLLAGAFLRKLEAVPGCVGAIVQIGSGAAVRPIAGWTAYCASKAALHHGTRVLAGETDPTRCRIFVLSPGVIETPMQAAIRAADDADMPDAPAFRAMAADGQLRSPAVPARWLRSHLDRWELPHDEVVDLFGWTPDPE